MLPTRERPIGCWWQIPEWRRVFFCVRLSGSLVRAIPLNFLTKQLVFLTHCHNSSADTIFAIQRETAAAAAAPKGQRRRREAQETSKRNCSNADDALANRNFPQGSSSSSNGCCNKQQLHHPTGAAPRLPLGDVPVFLP